MRSLIRLTLVLTFALTLGIFVFGALAPMMGSDSQHSPYISALSATAVRPAEAIPCNNQVCAVDHGQFFQCLPNEPGFTSHCNLSADRRSCTDLIPCP